MAFKELKLDTLRTITRKNNADHAAWQAGRISKAAFEEAETRRGWCWTPANIILNDRFQLNVTKMIMFDWAHIYVHDGLGDVEFGLAMSTLQKESKYNTSFAECGQVVSQFQLPKSTPKLDHLFHDDKNRNNYRKKSFTCTGSQFLTLTPLLHYYFDKVVKPRGEQLEIVNSMLAVLSVIMLLTSLKELFRLSNSPKQSFCICTYFRLRGEMFMCGQSTITASIWGLCFVCLASFWQLSCRSASIG